MRKISLLPYKNSAGIPYEVQKSIIVAMFNPTLQLGGRDLITQDRIARKIEAATESVLLEDSEYARVQQAFESFKGFGRDDVELVRRVLEAEEITVKEA